MEKVLIVIKPQNNRGLGLNAFYEGKIVLGQVKVGDVIPVQISYGDLNINADVKIVTASDVRAGAEFVNLDRATANKLLYMNILLNEANNITMR